MLLGGLLQKFVEDLRAVYNSAVPAGRKRKEKQSLRREKRLCVWKRGYQKVERRKKRERKREEDLKVHIKKKGRGEKEIEKRQEREKRKKRGEEKRNGRMRE